MSNLREKIDGRLVVASLSSGKDSVALSLWLTEQGIEHDRIFLDTRWEHSAVAEHLDYLRGKLGPITALSGPLGMVDMIRKKGMFPSRVRRFCTEELKTFPARDYLNARMAGGDDVINAPLPRSTNTRPASARQSCGLSQRRTDARPETAS